MGPESTQRAEDRVAAQIEGLDAALAAGGPPPVIDPTGFSPADLATILAAHESLRHLEQLWPRGGARPERDVGTEAALEELGPFAEFGRFRIVRELGRGGFGVVFLAVDPDLNRPVALKLPRAEWLMDAKGRERFVREARAVARLDHPNIAPLYEAGEVHGVYYMTSLFCDGPDLAKWLHERGGPIEPRTAAQMVVELADAVEHAHDRGVLHRDLKPSNVVLQCRRESPAAPGPGNPMDRDPPSEFSPRIVDFGLARLMERPGVEITASFAAMGSAPYMSPEQVEGRKVGRGADVYGLGALLYAMLCGRPPHRGRTDMDTLRRVVDDDIVAPRRLRRELSRDLEAICLKCLERDPARRYLRAGAVGDDLRRYLAGTPTFALSRGRWDRALRAVRRHRRTLARLGIIAVAATLGLAGFSQYDAGLRAARDLANHHAAEAQRSDQAARRNKYLADVRQAAGFVRNTQTDRAMELLRRNCPGPGADDLREFVWYHLLQRCRTERLSLAGHRGEVYHAEFSPDGQSLASCGQDGTVRLWDRTTGSLIRTIQAHLSEVNWVAFSPDGRELATTSDDGRVRLWNIRTGSRRHDLLAHQGIALIARFTRDGRRLVSCGREDGDVKEWDVATGHLLGSFHSLEPALENMDISADGNTIAVAGHRGAAVFDRASGRRVANLGPGELSLAGLAFSHDPSGVATGGADRIIRLWEARAGRLVREFSGHLDGVQSLTFTPNGRTLISAGDDKTVRLWDVATGRLLRIHSGHSERIWGVSVSPDGMTIVSAARDGIVRLWDSNPPTFPIRLAVKEPLKAATFSADGLTLISAGASGLMSSWDPRAGRLEETRRLGVSGPIADIVLDQCGTVAAVRRQDGFIEIHDLERRRRRNTIGPVRDPVARMEFDPTGRAIAIAEGDLGASLWDIARAKRSAVLEGHIGRAVFGPHGRIFCSAGRWKNELVVWDPAGGQRTAPGISWTSWSCARVSLDGTRFVIADWHTANVWSSDSLNQLASMEGHTASIQSLDFSPDGRTLASGDEVGVIKLWDVAAGEELMTLEPHAGPIRSVRFSPDGRMLASCADRPDGTGEIFLWQAASEESAQKVENHE